MISWQRTIYTLGLATLEATLAALVLTVLGQTAWALLVGVVLAGALADWLLQRWLAPERQGVALFGLGLALGLWAVKGAAGGGYGLLAGWDAGWRGLFTIEGQSAAAYALLFVTMYAFWRGTRLLNHDSASLQRLFGRAVVAILVIIGLGGAFGVMPAAHVARVTAQVFVFFCVGLLTIALVSAVEEHGARLDRIDWRGFATLAGAVMAVLVLGLLVAAIFGEQAAAIARAVWQAIVLFVLLIFSPLLLALGALITWVMSLLPLGEANTLLQQQQQGQQQQFDTLQQAAGIPPWLAVPTQIFCVAVPLLILLALFVFIRRRPARVPAQDEERESLLSWGGVVADMRDLLGGLRGRGGGIHGLRAALARLRGDDPATRIRRSYIQLLLAGEARDTPRQPPQTPREYETRASSMLPRAAAAVARLTRAYERARYHPSGTSTADAEAAEQALREVQQEDAGSR